MAGRTRLYQQAKSPLIQGRSKHERPAWQSWLAATLLGAVIAVALVGAYLYLSAPSNDIDLLPLGLAMMTPYAFAGSALGAVVAVWLSGLMGWRRRRLLGATLTASAMALVAIGVSVVVGGQLFA